MRVAEPSGWSRARFASRWDAAGAPAADDLVGGCVHASRLLGQDPALVLAGGGLPMGQVIGRSTANGGEPADDPITMRNLIGTIMHTLFDVAELRLRPNATDNVAKIMTESEPIKRLMS